MTKEKKNKINRNSSILILILLFSPFTKLRIFNIGVSESLSILLFLKFLNKGKNHFKKKNNSLFSRFWILYFCVASISTFLNYIIFYGNEKNDFRMIFDVVAYIVVILFVIGAESLNLSRKFDLEAVLKKFYERLSVILFFLYLISLKTGSILGLSLKYYHYFVPFATNIHHLTMIIGPLFFLGLRTLHFEEKPRKKLLYLVLLLTNIIIIKNANATKLILGIVVGVITLLLSIIERKLSLKSKYILGLLLVMVIVLVVGYSHEELKVSFVKWFEGADTNDERKTLYYSALENIKNSLFLGRGFGIHTRTTGGRLLDTHQSILTAVLQTGVFMGGYLVWLISQILYKCKKDSFLLAACMPILIYILGGDVLRRLPIWVFLFIFYYLPEKKMKSHINNH